MCELSDDKFVSKNNRFEELLTKINTNLNEINGILCHINDNLGNIYAELVFYTRDMLANEKKDTGKKVKPDV